MGTILAWFNGKKALIGATLIALPALIAALSDFLTAIGAAGPVKYLGIALIVVGYVHKLFKFFTE